MTEQLIRKPRRRWKYPSREATEKDVERISMERDNLARCFQAMICDRVTWLPKKYGNSNKAYYRFGIVPSKCESLVICVFYSPETGQRPHTAVFGYDRLEEEIRCFSVCQHDDLALAYRDGLYDARFSRNEADKKGDTP